MNDYSEKNIENVPADYIDVDTGQIISDTTYTYITC